VMLAMGFFLAFMMLGSVAYLQGAEGGRGGASSSNTGRHRDRLHQLHCV
jgi:hypothetical protein